MEQTALSLYDAVQRVVPLHERTASQRLPQGTEHPEHRMLSSDSCTSTSATICNPAATATSGGADPSYLSQSDYRLHCQLAFHLFATAHDAS